MRANGDEKNSGEWGMRYFVGRMQIRRNKSTKVKISDDTVTVTIEVKKSRVKVKARGWR